MTSDLGLACAIVNLLASLGALWVMQAVTADFHLGSLIGLVKLGHRAALAALAIVLFANAASTLWSGTDPRPGDLAVQVALLAVIALSAARHCMVARP